jgi:beta-lactam-binding protein with PASTA domain/tRNA A-37 threonylcarbamoyl transferase component Bud32
VTERVEPAHGPASAPTPPHQSAPGVRLLSGRYQLGEVLGYGGMAEVYKARDVRLDRDVAIKLLRSDLARDPSFQARFRREAQSAAALTHPMIVSVYDTGSDEKHDPPLPYIVMEYVDGHTLRDVLHLDGRLTQNRALEIMIDVSAALDYSHRAGIVHRDIKPGNVMITRDGSVKVMDFGIARAIAQSTATVTQTAAVMGTAQYLSPEQARGEKVDARSDLYSAGVVLYELLTGQPPFQGDSPVAVAYQHVREDPIPPSDLESDLSADADAVVMKMLAKNPGNRYQNAAEMSDDLGRALGGRRVLATPLLRQPTPAHTSGRPRGKRPERPRESRPGARRLLIVALLTLLSVAAVAGGLLLAFDGGSGDKKVAAPIVVGLTRIEARRAILNAGLALGVETARTSNENVDIVLSSEPPAGLKLAKDTKINLVYSSGPAAPEVPADILGMTQQQAEARLKGVGLTFTVTLVVTPGKTVGTVSGSSPPVNTMILTTLPVTLLVEGPTTVVPSLVSLNVGNAIDQLKRADLQFQTQDQLIPADSTVADGQVLSQSLNAGTQQNRGTVVILVVSKKAPPSPTPTPKPSKTKSPTPKPTASQTLKPAASSGG